MEQLIKEIELHSKALPDDIQQEVLDFIKLKESKFKNELKKNIEVSLLSESALFEWNNDEEDAAWKSYQ